VEISSNLFHGTILVVLDLYQLTVFQKTIFLDLFICGQPTIILNLFLLPLEIWPSSPCYYFTWPDLTLDFQKQWSMNNITIWKKAYPKLLHNEVCKAIMSTKIFFWVSTSRKKHLSVSNQPEPPQIMRSKG